MANAKFQYNSMRSHPNTLNSDMNNAANTGWRIVGVLPQNDNGWLTLLLERPNPDYKA